MHGMEMGGQLNRIIEQNYKYLTNNLKNLSWHLIGFEINKQQQMSENHFCLYPKPLYIQFSNTWCLFERAATF